MNRSIYCTLSTVLVGTRQAPPPPHAAGRSSQAAAPVREQQPTAPYLAYLNTTNSRKTSCGTQLPGTLRNQPPHRTGTLDLAWPHG